MARIDDVLNRMAALADHASERIKAIGRDAAQPRIFKADIVNAANRAIRPFIPRIRTMLLQNFKAAGFKEGEHRTGRLEKGVRTAHVWCSVDKGGQIVLLYGLGKDLQAEVYRYGQSLASGAVRAPMKNMPVIDLPTRRVVGNKRRSVLGAKAKKSVKMAALGIAPLSKRSKAYLEKSSNTAVGDLKRDKGSIKVDIPNRIESDKSVKVGQVVVIKPRVYFQLTDAQVATFKDEFMAELQKYLAPEMDQKGVN